MYNLITPIIETLWGVTFAEATGNVALAMEIAAHISMWLLYALLLFLLCSLCRAIANPLRR